MGKDIYILEFNHSKLRCCASRTRRGKRFISHCFSVPLEKVSSGSRSLQEEFRKRKFNPKEPIVVLPGQSGCWQSMRLPSQNEHEIRQIVSCYMSRQTFSGTGVYDYQYSGQDNEGYSLIQAVTLPEKRLDSCLKILKILKVEPSVLTFNVQGFLQWMLMKSEEGHCGRPFCLLNKEDEYFDFSVIASGRVFFSRSFVSPESAPFLFMRELKAALNSCRNLGLDLKGRRLYFSGELSENELEIAGSCGLELEKTPNKLSFEQALGPMPLAEGNSFLSCLGFALNPSEKGFDMRPAEFRQSISEKRISRIWFKATAFFCVFIFCLWCCLALLLHNFSNDVKKLNDEAKMQAVLLERIEKASLERWAMEKIFKDEDAFPGLGQLYKIDLSGIALAEYKLNMDSVVLKGRAKDMKNFFRFLHSLKTTAYFSKAGVDSLSEDKTGDSAWPVSYRIISPVPGKN